MKANYTPQNASDAADIYSYSKPSIAKCLSLGPFEVKN